MNLEKLKPWNWFKHEETANQAAQQVAATRNEHMSATDSLVSLHREMDRWFDNMASAFGLPVAIPGTAVTGPKGASFANFYQPQIDVSGDANCYEIKLDVPGMTESDLSIEVRDDVLVIRGEQRQQNESSDRHYYRVERSYGAFQRTLSLPDDADTDEIDARIDSGVLRLEIPRRESSDQDVRRIAISS